MGTWERSKTLERCFQNFSGPTTFQNFPPSSKRVWKNAFVQVLYFWSFGENLPNLESIKTVLRRTYNLDREPSQTRNNADTVASPQYIPAVGGLVFVPRDRYVDLGVPKTAGRRAPKSCVAILFLLLTGGSIVSSEDNVACLLPSRYRPSETITIGEKETTQAWYDC